MRFASTVLSALTLGALFGEVDATYRYRHTKSKWAIQRTENIKNRLERTYGLGAVGMIDPLTGKIDPERFGWDNRLTGGAKLGSSISRTITEGFTIDASTAMAYWLGFAKGMQYSAMDREGDNLPGANAILTNCFASTYGMMTSFDTLGYNWSTLTSSAGQFKGFDVLVIDPTKILADIVVNFEMCEVGKIIDSAKAMASLDYASIVDSTTRYLLVIMVDSPEARTEIMKMKDAGQCAQKVKEDFDKESAKDAEEKKKKEKEDDEWEEFGDGDNAGDSTQWDSSEDFSFAADPDVFAADAEASANEAAQCFAAIDKFTIGEISGKLFAHFFNNELKPLI